MLKHICGLFGTCEFYIYKFFSSNWASPFITFATEISDAYKHIEWDRKRQVVRKWRHRQETRCEYSISSTPTGQKPAGVIPPILTTNSNGTTKF